MLVPLGSLSSSRPSTVMRTLSTVSNSVSVCTMALTITLSLSASESFVTSSLRSTRATPPEISSSTCVFSGRTVLSPSLAASISLYRLLTIRPSVAFAMPSSSGICLTTGTR